VHGVRIPVRHYPQREPQLQPQLSQIQSHPHLQRRGFLNIFGSANPEPKPQPKEGTVPITKIGMELLSQDPKNRITFAGAGFFTLKSRLPWSRQKTAVDVVGMFPVGLDDATVFTLRHVLCR
jgi:hypothetical protein